jgi:trigger factor
VPSTVEQLSPTRVKITVEVPFADLKPSMDKAYAEIAKSISIPGFRRGKVPPMVIDQRFGRGAVIQEAFNDSWMRFYGAAVSENQLAPVAQPELEVTKLEDGDLIEFTAEVDVRPDFELPDFSTVQVTVDAIDVPESQVDEQIDVLRNRFGSREVVERPAADGDVVTINLVASQNGEPLPDATAEGLEYILGSGEMLDGLDDAVTGLSAGESATFTSTLVGGPLKDESAEIEVTVTQVQQQELPAVDDELAQQASEFDTVEELRGSIRERLTAAARLDQGARARDAVLEELITRLDIEVPENLLASELDARRQQITGQLGQAQLSLEQYLAEAEENQTEDEFWADVEKRSTQALKAQMILDKIAEERQLGVDQNDLTQHILRKAQAENASPQQIADHLQEHPHHIEEYMTEIRRGKALGLIVESATVTDSNGEPVELAKLREDGTLVEAGADDETEGADEDDADEDDADEAAEDTSGAENTEEQAQS